MHAYSLTFPVLIVPYYSIRSIACRNLPVHLHPCHMLQI